MIVSARHADGGRSRHRLGSDRRDDVVLVDLFPMDLESACYADITRTFAVGAVRRDPLARLVPGGARPRRRADPPGVNGGDVHRLVSELFAEHGYPTQLTKAEGAGPPRRLLPRARSRGRAGGARVAGASG